MLIDFHMHLFPDRLAARTLAHLSAVSGGPYHTDGTVTGALAAMDAGGVDYGVVLHIATKEAQQRTVNDFAKRVQDENERLFCFGSVFPQGESAMAELDRIKELGLYGIKLHPDYQGFFFGDEQYFPLYEHIAALGLPLTIHAGWDPVAPAVTHAPPEAIARVAKAIPSLILIAAHMGGMCRYAEAEEHLAGLPSVYLDTSMSSVCWNDPAAYLRLIRRHGADHILFATDCPWSTVPAELSLLRSLGLTLDELERITWRNAREILKMREDAGKKITAF